MRETTMIFADILKAFPEIRGCDHLGRPLDGKPYKDERARDKHRDYSIQWYDLEIWHNGSEQIFTVELPSVMYFYTGTRGGNRFYFIERRVEMAAHGFTRTGLC